MFADFKVYFLAHRVESPVHGGQQKNFPSALGLVFCLFAVTVINEEAYTKQKEQDGQRGLETSLKNNKDGGRSREEIFFGFPRRFLEVFLALSTHHAFRSNSKENKSYSYHGLKDFGGFKGRQEMSRFQVVPFAISANFGFNLSVKIYARENPYKNGEFLIGFLAQKKNSEIR